MRPFNYETFSNYVAYLTDNEYGMETMDKFYFTNLCNEFLPHPGKKNETVLIPDDRADHGISEIEKTVKVGSFRLILPMSLQVFYHLVRRRFVPNESDDMKEFLRKAQPDESYALQGAYRPIKQRAFVEVCGGRYLHQKLPVIPILHVKNWQKMVRNEPYRSRMGTAVNNIWTIWS